MNGRTRWGLIVVTVGLIVGGSYWLGYQMGLRDGVPHYQGLMVIQRNVGTAKVTGTSATWYDVNKPEGAAKLRADREKLVARGTEHYVTEAVVETSIRPVSSLEHVKDHR